MKYLKKFNESLSSDFTLDLKEFCESYLAYLLDEGFEVDVQHRYNNTKEYKHDYHFITMNDWVEKELKNILDKNDTNKGN